MTTRGIEHLEEDSIPHEVLTYQHEVKGVRYAAQMLGLPDEIVIKSLIFQANDGSFIFALMSGDGNVSEKNLAHARPFVDQLVHTLIGNVNTICQFPLRNSHWLEKLLQKHLVRMRRFSTGRYTHHFSPPNGSPQSLRLQARFRPAGLPSFFLPSHTIVSSSARAYNNVAGKLHTLQKQGDSYVASEPCLYFRQADSDVAFGLQRIVNVP